MARVKLDTLPPILDAALLTRLAAPDAAVSAEVVTLDRPSEALDCMFDAVFFAFDAASEAFSVAFSVVDAYCRSDLNAGRVVVGRLKNRREAIDGVISNVARACSSSIEHRPGVIEVCWSCSLQNLLAGCPCEGILRSPLNTLEAAFTMGISVIFGSNTCCSQESILQLEYSLCVKQSM